MQENPGAARNSDPDTSHAAAESVDAAAMEAIVYKTMLSFPKGCISDQVVDALPEYRRHSVIPRFAALKAKGLIVDTGFRRMASSGRSQRVLKAIP